MTKNPIEPMEPVGEMVPLHFVERDGSGPSAVWWVRYDAIVSVTDREDGSLVLYQGRTVRVLESVPHVLSLISAASCGKVKAESTVMSAFFDRVAREMSDFLAAAKSPLSPRKTRSTKLPS